MDLLSDLGYMNAEIEQRVLDLLDDNFATWIAENCGGDGMDDLPDPVSEHMTF